jgi:hypothetical protein
VIVAKDDLDSVLQSAQKRPMNAEEREAQRRSFVYGNTKIEYDCLTREIVEEVADALAPSTKHE